jgi:asparagine synthase (glutamine-hydrolysing)
MYHYVACLWNPRDHTACATVANWSARLARPESNWGCPLSTDGLLVYEQTPRESALRIYVLPDGFGVVLGRLFPTNVDAVHHNWTPSIDAAEAARIVESGGREFTQSYWGNYVGFFRDGSKARTFMVRDCSGRIPCYRLTHNGVHIIFSDIADLDCLKLPKIPVNLRYLAAFVSYTELQIRDCGLSGVTEVLAGECFELIGDSISQFSVWNPLDIYNRATIDDYDFAMSELRHRTQCCIDAWAGAYTSIVHRLSGGLDSAIVLGTMKKSPVSPRITCLNVYGSNPLEDERRYARLAAECAGVRLMEQNRDEPAWAFDSNLLALPKVPKPSLPPLFIAQDIQQTNRLALEVNADVVSTGQGGDHLFLETRNLHSAADYLANHGVQFGAISAIVDAAHLSRTPYIWAARDAWRLARSKRRWMPESTPGRKAAFVNQEALPMAISEYIAHPWTMNSEKLPKGKQWQLFYLAEVLNRHRPLPRAEFAYEQHPLLSQPLVELCLQIPTYVLLKGGQSRALAREAFRDRVPLAILKRQEKGDSTFTVTDMFRRSEAYLTELLMDGILVRERIIVRDQIERYLVHRECLRPEHCVSIIACIAAELWVRAWSTNAVSRAA